MQYRKKDEDEECCPEDVSESVDGGSEVVSGYFSYCDAEEDAYDEESYEDDFFECSSKNYTEPRKEGVALCCEDVEGECCFCTAHVEEEEGVEECLETCEEVFKEG